MDWSSSKKYQGGTAYHCTKKQKSIITKNVLIEKLNPAEIDVEFTEGSVIIQCNNQKSLSNLKTKVELEMGQDYNIRTATFLKPKIKMIGVNEDDCLGITGFVIRLTNQNFRENLRTGDI